MSQKLSIRGTQTEQNLLKAFAGESQARNRYTYFSRVAQNEGYELISRFFALTAENEREHAHQFFSFLEGGSLEITATYPSGLVSTTPSNLRLAAENEYDEWSDLYPEFAKVAEDEGFASISMKFLLIAKIEQHHEARYRELLARVESDTLFSRPEPVVWRCMECGHEYLGTDAPRVCPVCNHPQSFFEPIADPLLY